MVAYCFMNKKYASQLYLRYKPTVYNSLYLISFNICISGYFTQLSAFDKVL